MAILDDSAAIDFVKGQNQFQIHPELSRRKAKKVRNELHTFTHLEDGYYKHGQAQFFNWVGGMLRNEETLSAFKAAFCSPVATIQTTEAIFSEHSKVFEARDSFRDFNISPAFEDDFKQFRDDRNYHNYWKTEGFDLYQNSIDSIMVVDMIPEGERLTALPEPYFYPVDLSRVVNVLVKRNNLPNDNTDKFKIEALAFLLDTQADGTEIIGVLDDAKYRTFTRKEGTIRKGEIDSPHSLGYTPARSFWTTPLNDDSLLLKRNQVTGLLGDLDWLLFWITAKKVYDLYGPFPMYFVYKSACNYRHPETQERCADGRLRTLVGGSIEDGNASWAWEDCPACSKRMSVGPNQYEEIEPPREAVDVDLMRNPMQVVGADVQNLEYIDAQIDKHQQRIWLSAVGQGGEAVNDQAVNQKQIGAFFESRKNVLSRISKNFELIDKWSIDTVGRLRYSSAIYDGSTVINGTQFFGKDESEVLSDYQEATKANLPAYEINARRQTLNQVRYENDPAQLEKIKIYEHLEPYPTMTISQVADLRSKDPKAMSRFDWLLKANFNDWIMRFERENGNILQFADSLSFAGKIEAIKSRLRDYFVQLEAETADVLPDPAPNNPPE